METVEKKCCQGRKDNLEETNIFGPHFINLDSHAPASPTYIYAHAI